MPIGQRTKQALAARIANGEVCALDEKGRKLCVVCGEPFAAWWALKHPKALYCSDRCEITLRRTRDPVRATRNKKRYVKKRRKQQTAARRQASKQLTSILTTPPGVAAVSTALTKKAGVPLAGVPTTTTAADIAPPSTKEMRAFLRERFGADGYRLLQKLEEIAFATARSGVQPKVRVDCIKELLDRGWGKTTQSIAVAAVAPIFAVPEEGRDSALLPDLGNEQPEDVIEAEVGAAEDSDTGDNLDEQSEGPGI